MSTKLDGDDSTFERTSKPSSICGGLIASKWPFLSAVLLLLFIGLCRTKSFLSFRLSRTFHGPLWCDHVPLCSSTAPVDHPGSLGRGLQSSRVLLSRTTSQVFPSYTESGGTVHLLRTLSLTLSPLLRHTCAHVHVHTHTQIKFELVSFRPYRRDCSLLRLCHSHQVPEWHSTVVVCDFVVVVISRELVKDARSVTRRTRGAHANRGLFSEESLVPRFGVTSLLLWLRPFEVSPGLTLPSGVVGSRSPVWVQ